MGGFEQMVAGVRPASRRRRAGALATVVALVVAGVLVGITPQLAAGAVGDSTTFTVPGGQDGVGITAGPDGNVWFVDRDADLIGRVTPAGTVATFSDPAVEAPFGITAGSDGNLWFTFHGRLILDPFTPAEPGIGRITPDGTITVFDDDDLSAPSGITLGDDDNVWFGDGNFIGRITPAGTITTYFAGATVNAGEITAGPDGDLWFTPGGLNDGYVGTITTAGVVDLVELSQDVFSMAWIRTGPDGKLWFSRSTGAAMGTITTNGTVEFLSTPALQFTGMPTLGSDGNMWIFGATPGFQFRFARVTPAGTFTVFPATSLPTHLGAGPDGNVWFTASGQVGRIEVTGPPAPTRRPDAQVRKGSGPFVGDDVYNVNGAGQTRKDARRAGQAASFTVLLQNDGSAAERLRVKGQRSTNRFTVKYFSGATNVTNQVGAGTFRTPVLAPGATRALRVTVTPKASAPVNSSLARTVTVSSDNTPAIKDVVKVTVKRLR